MPPPKPALAHGAAVAVAAFHLCRYGILWLLLSNCDFSAVSQHGRKAFSSTEQTKNNTRACSGPVLNSSRLDKKMMEIGTSSIADQYTTLYMHHDRAMPSPFARLTRLTVLHRSSNLPSGAFQMDLTYELRAPDQPYEPYQHQQHAPVCYQHDCALALNTARTLFCMAPHYPSKTCSRPQHSTWPARSGKLITLGLILRQR